MKRTKKIIVIIVVVFVAFGLLKNPLLKAVIQAGASSVTGTKVRIDRFSLGIFRPGVEIKGLKVYNPKGFPKGILMDIDEISVRYKLSKLLVGKIDLPQVVLDLRHMVLVKNEKGELNVDSLKMLKKAEKASGKKAKEKKEKAAAVNFHIDEARLDFGQVIVKDYTQGDPPAVVAYDIGVHDKIIKNINEPGKLATIVMVEAMGPTALKSAGLYAAATVLGVGFLPAGVAGVLIGKDHGVAEFDAGLDRVFQATKDALSFRGKISQEDAVKGVIKAKQDGADITVEIKALQKKKTEVLVKARKIMIPKPEIANGVLYLISEELK